MAESARQLGQSLIGAPPRRVNIASDAAALVALHAQLFTGSAVAGGARERVRPRRSTVGILGRGQAYPSQRVRAQAELTGGPDPLLTMTVVAALGGVTDRARPGRRARLVGVASAEARSMELIQAAVGAIKLELGGQRRNAHAVAAEAKALAVTGLTIVALTTREEPMALTKVRPVSSVRDRPRRLGGQVLVALTADAPVVGVLMLMAAQAGAHGGRDRVIFGDLVVAAGAVAVDGLEVSPVLKAQVLAVLLWHPDAIRRGVAVGAGAVDVGALVTGLALRGAREMQLGAGVGFVDPDVTAIAGHALRQVRAVREAAIELSVVEAQDAGAGHQERAQHDRE